MGGRTEGNEAHPFLDQPQCVFEAFISCHLVVLVGLHVEVCDVVHHLQHRNKPRKDNLYTALKQTNLISPDCNIYCSSLRFFTVFVSGSVIL